MNTSIYKYALPFATFVLVVGALYLFAPILAPFVAGAILAYLSDPLIERLQRLKLSRGLAVTLVFLILTAFVALLILLLLPVLQDQVSLLIERAPRYLESIDQWISVLAERFGVTLNSSNLKTFATEYWPEPGESTKSLLGAISKSGSALVGGIAFMLLTPIITFYLLRDWDDLLARVRELIPHSARETTVRLAEKCDTMLSAFIRGQLMVMTSLAVIYATGLTLINLQFGLLIGVIAGLLSFIPYLGTAVGVILASVLFLVEHKDWIGLWQVALVFSVGQILEGYILTPRLVGDKIGLHPVVVIFAVLAGGQLFGFVGVLLALPVSAVIAVLVRELLSRYKESEYYLGEEDH